MVYHDVDRKGNHGNAINRRNSLLTGGGNVVDNRITARHHHIGGSGGIEETAGLLNGSSSDFVNEDASWIDSESREIQ